MQPPIDMPDKLHGRRLWRPLLRTRRRLTDALLRPYEFVDEWDVRFDWRVHADRRLLRALTPVLRPALRWNHDWAIARAIEGLEPYARTRT